MLRIGLPLAMLCASMSVQALAADSYSWGKPGASRDDFERGSRACMLQAAKRDVAGDAQTKRYVRGTDVLDRENNMPPMGNDLIGNDSTFTRSERQVLLRRAYAPDRQVDSLQAQLQSEVDQCLVEAGYVRFALSREPLLPLLSGPSPTHMARVAGQALDRQVGPAEGAVHEC